MKKNLVKTFLVMSLISVMLTGCGKKDIETFESLASEVTSVVASVSEEFEESEVVESESIEVVESSEVEESVVQGDKDQETGSGDQESEESVEASIESPETSSPVETSNPVSDPKVTENPKETTAPQETAKPVATPKPVETTAPTEKPQETTTPVTTPTPEVHTHKYTEKVTTKATCKSTGVKTFTCSCGDSYTETIAKTTTHTFNDGPSCTVCGTANPNYVKPEPTPEPTQYNCGAGVHKWVQVNEYEEECELCLNVHVLKCNPAIGAHLDSGTCGDRTTIDDTHVANRNHSWCRACGWETYNQSIDLINPETGVMYEESGNHDAYSHNCSK